MKDGRGRKQGTRYLNKSEVFDILRTRDDRSETHAEAAESLGVSRTVIRNIRAGRGYKDWHAEYNQIGADLI